MSFYHGERTRGQLESVALSAITNSGHRDDPDIDGVIVTIRVFAREGESVLDRMTELVDNHHYFHGFNESTDVCSHYLIQNDKRMKDERNKAKQRKD